MPVSVCVYMCVYIIYVCVYRVGDCVFVCQVVGMHVCMSRCHIKYMKVIKMFSSTSDRRICNFIAELCMKESRW